MIKATEDSYNQQAAAANYHKEAAYHRALINELEDIKNIWKYGHIWIGEYVNEKTINYIVKYCNKLDTQHKGYVPKIMTSSGIGKKFIERIDSEINRFNGEDTIEYYRTNDGLKLSLQIYYRNK